MKCPYCCSCLKIKFLPGDGQLYFLCKVCGRVYGVNKKEIINEKAEKIRERAGITKVGEDVAR